MKKTLILAIMTISSFHTFAQTPIKVAAVGNSITEGSGREHPSSYPNALQELLGEEFEVRNFGVGGRTLLKKGDFPYWDEPQYEEVKNFAPDILIIKLGTNDSKPQNWKHKDEFEQDYIELIHELKTSMPENGKVYVCLPVPVFEDNYGINERTIKQEMRPILNRVITVTNAKVIDLHSPLKQLPHLFPDGVHPNEEGLRIMAETIAEEIKQTNSSNTEQAENK
jgi:acyl-CoA thioesterase I